MRLLTVAVVTCVLFIGGCASPRQWSSEENVAANNAIGECWKAQGVIANTRLSKLSNSNDVLLSQAIEGLSAAANKGRNPCGDIKTSADVEIVAMQENTKRSEYWINFGKSALSTGMWMYIGGKAVDAVADMKSGDKYEFKDTTVKDSFNKADLKQGDLNWGVSTPTVVHADVVQPTVVDSASGTIISGNL